MWPFRSRWVITRLSRAAGSEEQGRGEHPVSFGAGTRRLRPRHTGGAEAISMAYTVVVSSIPTKMSMRPHTGVPFENEDHALPRQVAGTQGAGPRCGKPPGIWGPTTPCRHTLSRPARYWSHRAHLRIRRHPSPRG